MFKKGRAYLILGALALLLLLVFEYNKPKRINWFPSYVSTHKIPYGTKVFNDLLPNYFETVEQVYRTPYEFLAQGDSVQGTYLFINDNLNFGPTDLRGLLGWVEQGNHLFLASENFERELLDTLNLEISSIYDSYTVTPTFKHSLVNPKTKANPIAFEKDYYAPIFIKIDTVETIVLGKASVTNDSTNVVETGVNVVQQSLGDGVITLSMFPEAFTNYVVLKDDDTAYIGGLLAYIDPNKPLYIDNHHKSGKSFYSSPMYLFLNTLELKWAYYLVLIGALVYIIFEGKRKQRAIKVVEPLKNQTLSFTRTIADMYFENNRQNDIARHKIQYFLDYVRNRFYLSTEKIDFDFYKDLAARSNHSTEEIAALLKTFERIQKTTHVTNEQLESLEKRIQEFKAKADGK